MKRQDTEAEKLCRKLGIKAQSVMGCVDGPSPDMPAGSTSWTVTLSWGGPEGRFTKRPDVRTITTGFHMGPAFEREPKAADVLHSLMLDADTGRYCETFEDFCAEFGYDTDSRRAEQVYNACVASVEKVDAFLAGLDEDSLTVLREQ